MNDQPLRILYLASEVEPYARTGGLGEVAGALPIALRALGHDVRVAMPCYGHLNPERWQMQLLLDDHIVTLDHHEEHARIFTTNLPNSDVPTWLIDNDRLFGSPDLYLGEPDAERFIFWARASMETARKLDWQPDIIHANDWHAAITPNWLRTIYKRDPFWQNTASLYTIHTLAYRGVFGQRVLEIAGIAEYGFITHPDLPYLNRVVDLMSRGIYYADMINTVSPTHAKEITTPDFGQGLDPVLRDRRDRLVGISNGIDTERYNPANDSFIAQTYSVDNPHGKATCKQALQTLLNLPVSATIPVICFIGRLNDQKGFNLVQSALELLLSFNEIQFVVMGTGEDRYHAWCLEMQQRFPNAVRAMFTFNEELAHQFYAGSDMLLMPSLVEPSGTNQLIALRYGTLPVVRATGGLADTVENLDLNAKTGNGFTFNEVDTQALQGTLMRAIEMFRHANLWQRAMERAMRADHSWQRAAQHYDAVYRRALMHKPRQANRDGVTRL